MAWTRIAEAHTVKNGPTSGCILKVGATGFAAEMGAVYEKKKEMQDHTKILVNELFLSRHRCCSFLLVLLLFLTWNTDKDLEVGLEVEQVFGNLQRQA